MKTFKSFLGAILGCSALLFFSSCTKNVDEQSARSGNDAGKFTPAPAVCGPYIGMRSPGGNSTTGFFYVGDQNDLPNRQNFITPNDFTDDRYIKVSATGGLPYFDAAATKHIGVTDRWISGTEELWLSIGSALPGQMMQGFDLNVQADIPSVGSLDLYQDATWVGAVPVSISNGTSINYTTSGLDPKFNKIKVTASIGKLAIMGRYPNVNFVGPTRFYLVADANTFVGMQLNTGTTDGHDNWFINYRIAGVDQPASGRQYRNAGPSLAANSGAFGNVNPDKWLKMTSNTGTMVARYDNYRIGLGADQFIDAGEVLTIVPGSGFPAPKFRSFEVREALSGAGSHIMAVKLWNGATQVGGGNTTGIDATFNSFTASEDFDRVTIEWVSGKPSIGRYTPFGFAMKVYPGCP